MLLCKIFFVFAPIFIGKFVSFSSSARIYFSACSRGGFLCTKNAYKRWDINYSCPVGSNDTIIYLNQWGSPVDTDSLTITNCDTLYFSTRCSNEAKSIQRLTIINVTNLHFQRLQYESHLPPEVVLENITSIHVLPSKTFAQIEKSIHTIGCIIPKVDFEKISFTNVTIETMESNAIHGLNSFKNFTWNNVRIKRMQTSAINLRFDKSGDFKVFQSHIDIAEHLSFQLYGKKAVFSQNVIVDLSSSAINGTIESFLFVNNSVEKTNAYSMSLLATNVFILDNHFLYLKSGAFEKISPGLINDSGRNFGTLKFLYDFSKNDISFTDAGSLHPDMVAYENVATEMTFSRNKLYCSCANLGWIVSQIGHGTNTAALDNFYSIVLDPAYGNNCHSDCVVPLNFLERMMENGKCLDVTVEELCQGKLRRNGTSSTTTTTSKAVIRRLKTVKGSTEAIPVKAPIVNGSRTLKNDSNITYKFSFKYFIVLIVMSFLLLFC